MQNKDLQKPGSEFVDMMRSSQIREITSTLTVLPDLSAGVRGQVHSV